MLQQAGHAVYVVEEVLGVPEVEVVGTRVCTAGVSLFTCRVAKVVTVRRRTCVEEVLELVHVWHRPRQPVNTLEVEAKQVQSLDALIHHHRHRKPVTLIESGEINTKHRARRSHLRCCGR